MTTKHNPGIREPEHICMKELVLAKQSLDLVSQTRAIKRNTVLLNRLSKVSLGNGHEENGLLFIVRKFVDEHAIVLTDIHDIKEKLSIVAEVNFELEVRRRVQADREKTLKETRESDDIKLKKRTFVWSKIPIFAGVVTVVILLVFQILNYSINRHSATKDDVNMVKEKVIEQGTPTIVDTRSGEYVGLPPGYVIKMFPQDFNGNDTIKK